MWCVRGHSPSGLDDPHIWPKCCSAAHLPPPELPCPGAPHPRGRRGYLTSTQTDVAAVALPANSHASDCPFPLRAETRTSLVTAFKMQRPGATLPLGTPTTQTRPNPDDSGPADALPLEPHPDLPVLGSLAGTGPGAPGDGRPPEPRVHDSPRLKHGSFRVVRLLGLEVLVLELTGHRHVGRGVGEDGEAHDKGRQVEELIGQVDT
jgi:hypothetical protein